VFAASCTALSGSRTPSRTAVTAPGAPLRSSRPRPARAWAKKAAASVLERKMLAGGAFDLVDSHKDPAGRKGSSGNLVPVRTHAGPDRLLGSLLRCKVLPGNSPRLSYM